MRGLAVGRVGVAVADVAAHVGAGEAVAGRQRGLVELHAVGAGAQAGEQVVAVGVGGQRGADRVAGGVEQGDLDARNAGFAAVLLAVAVGVEPHVIAQFGQLIQAGVDVRVVLTGLQGDLSALTGGVHVAVGGVVAAGVLPGDDVAVRRLHGHRVGAGRHGEAVGAGAVGGGGLRGAAVGVLEHHGDPGNARFAGVLHAVGVGVEPHPVAQGGRTFVDEVVAGAALTRLQDHGDAVRVAAVAVAHVGVARLVAFFDRVAARRHAREAVVAVGVGGGGGDRGAVGALQDHGDAGNRGVAGVVVVEVFTHRAADGARQAFVDEEVAAAGGPRRHRDGDAVGVAAVAVAHVGEARLVAFFNHVVADRHIVEAVVAVGVGGGGLDHRVGERVLQHHGDAGNRGVARAVVVEVFEHRAGDGTRIGDEAGVPGLVRFAGVEHGLRGLAVGRVGVAVADVAARVGAGEAVAGRQRGLVELHAVGAGAQVGK